MLWSLSNRFKDVNASQLARLAQEFHAACEKNFGTKCALKLGFLDGSKSLTTLNGLTNPDQIIKTLEAESPKFWDKSTYINIRVDPIGGLATPPHAFGRMELKKCQPETIVYYIQGNDDLGTKEQITKNNPEYQEGNGSERYHRYCGILSGMGL